MPLYYMQITLCCNLVMNLTAVGAKKQSFCNAMQLAPLQTLYKPCFSKCLQCVHPLMHDRMSSMQSAHQGGPSVVPIREAYQGGPLRRPISDAYQSAHQGSLSVCPSGRPIREAHQGDPLGRPISYAYQGCSLGTPIRDGCSAHACMLSSRPVTAGLGE